MTIFPAHTQSRIRNLAWSAVYKIAADEACEPSDVLDILVAAPFTPSQPEVSSKAHAPAAQTGEGVSSSLASSPVEPIPEAPKPLPDAPDNPADALEQPAEAKISEPADGGAVSAVMGKARLENAEGVEPPPSAPPRQTMRQQVIDCHKAHPDWHSRQIAEHLNIGAHRVQTIACQVGFKLPPAPRPTPVSMREKVLAVAQANPDWSSRQIAAHLGCVHSTAARWMPGGEDKPAVAKAPAKRAVIAKPVPQNDATDVLHRVKHAPSGRFYLIERGDPLATRRYVHQSLQACPTGPGPMMTTDRRWAWFNTMDRFKGAVKQWPELAKMRKEAAHG